MLLAIAAHPVLHSLSPVLHRHALKKAGIEGSYLRLGSESADGALKLMRELGVSGINVSAPYKEEIARLLDETDDDAKAIGAVNTVITRNGKLYGYNTDIDGVIGALNEASLNLKGKEVIILGTGGAAKAAAQALRLLDAIPIVAGRNIETLTQFGHLGIKTIFLEEISNRLSLASGLVSTIPADSPIIETILLRPDHFVFDALYKDSAQLENRCKKVGATFIGGKRWLINQAVRAFELFTQTKIPVAVFDEALRDHKPLPKRLFYIGLMGSGKSTIGKLVADELALSHIDIDSLIEERHGPISQIFAEKGESFFRSLEFSTLNEVLQSEVNSISCGGGMILNPQAEALLKEEGYPIWLWASPEVLEQRLKNPSGRPLLQGASVSERINQLLSERAPKYAKTASIVFDTSDKEVSNVVKQICYEYRSTFQN